MVFPLLGLAALAKVSFVIYRLGQNNGNIERTVRALQDDIRNVGNATESVIIELPIALGNLAASEDLGSIAQSIKQIRDLLRFLPKGLPGVDRINKGVDGLIEFALLRASQLLSSSDFSVTIPGTSTEEVIEILSARYAGLYLLGHMGRRVELRFRNGRLLELAQLHRLLGDKVTSSKLQDFDENLPLLLSNQLKMTAAVNMLQPETDAEMVPIYITYALGGKFLGLSAEKYEGEFMRRFYFPEEKQAKKSKAA